MTKAETISTGVSAVITTYNRPDYLRSAIKSVLTQSHEVREIIVIDDCSPNVMAEVVEEFADERIQYERLSKNSGANRARNRGVEIATSEWIAFLDDDDEWLPDKTRLQLNELIRESSDQRWIGSVCSYRFLESGKDRVWGSTGVVELETLKSGNPYCGATGLVARREYLTRTKFDEALPCGQDWDIFVRLAAQGDLLYLKDPLFLYRRGSHDSVTLKAKSLKIEELHPRLASIYKHQAWLGNQAFRLRLANQTLAYIPQKKNRLRWIRESVRLAGWSATVRVLLRKVWSLLPLGRA